MHQAAGTQKPETDLAGGTRVLTPAECSARQAHSWVPRRCAGAVALAVLLLCVTTVGGWANGHSVTLYLSYLADVSNWGPVEATGTATVNVGEGAVLLDASGLSPLEGQVYEVWLVTADRADWQTLGRFQLDSDGEALYEDQVEGVEPRDYRYLVVSVEALDDPDPAPSGVYSIGGIFPNPEAVSTESQAESEGVASEPTLTAEASPEVAPPSYLPETGARFPAPSFGLVLAAAAAGLCVVARGVHGGDRHARRLHRQ